MLKFDQIHVEFLTNLIKIENLHQLSPHQLEIIPSFFIFLQNSCRQQVLSMKYL